MNARFKAFRTRLTNFIVKELGGEIASDTTSRYLNVFGCKIRIADHESPYHTQDRSTISILCPLSNTRDIIIKTGLVVRVVHNIKDVKLALSNLVHFIQLTKLAGDNIEAISQENKNLKNQLKLLTAQSISTQGLTPKQVNSVKKLITGYRL